MKLVREEVREMVYKVVQELNGDREDNSKFHLSEDTVLFGQDSNLDSLGLVNLIVGVEQTLLEEKGLELILANEKAMSQRRSPFRTVGSLVDYICFLGEKA